MTSSSKCGFCEMVGHNIRHCTDPLIDHIVQDFRQVNLIETPYVLSSYRSVDLSIIMIHMYQASSVSMSKPEKIAFIQARWSPHDQEDQEEEDYYDEDEDPGFLPEYLPALPTIPDIVIPPLPENPPVSDIRLVMMITKNCITVMNSQLDVIPIHLYESIHDYLRVFRETIEGIYTVSFLLLHPEYIHLARNALEREMRNYMRMVTEARRNGIVSNMLVFKPSLETSNDKSVLECPVCYDSFQEKYVGKFVCKHYLCVNCLSSLPKNKELTCPCCRGAISSVIIEDTQTRNVCISHFKEQHRRF